jgi:UDP-GlcNAc:undecaprenyl-phosphate/decaprenyl-phosphate GlcNAc-1-phosphate transferase
MSNEIYSLSIIAFAITFLLTPLTIKIANKLGLVDNSKIRPHPAHTHKGIIPRAGGLPLFLGIFIPLFFLFPNNKEVLGILIGALILVMVGLWDDKKDRSPYLRFFLNIVAGAAAIFAGLQIPYITNPLGGILHFENTLLPAIFALLWIVWTTNIVGWSGGVDGQMPGFVSISAIVIGLLSLRYSINDPTQLIVTYLSFLTAGAFLGFLPWNFFPQKIMPGYGGKSLAGFMLAVLSILSYSKLGTALLVLAVPMTDAVFIFIKRLFSGKSPVWSSSGHLHHMLLKIGWSKKKIAFFYWSISAITGIIALTLSSRQKVFAAVLILIIISGFLLWINYFRNFKSYSTFSE